MPPDADRRATPEGRRPAWFVGVYPLLPQDETRTAAYRRLTERAREDPEFRGLEVPFTGPFDIDELTALLADDGEIVLTTIPGVVAELTGDPGFGLASADPEGRERARRYIALARDAVTDLNQAAGRAVVRGVTLHSAPAAARSAADAFERSLTEIAGWDWGGAHLLVEHCDAAVPGRVASKGFLGLDDELDALDAVGHERLGVLINWGRSAIEGRSPLRAVEHLRQARERGLLRGLMFSGCSPHADARGGAWADFHLPPASVDPLSLLDERAARDAVAAAGDVTGLVVTGMKVGAPATADLDARERILVESASVLLGALR